MVKSGTYCIAPGCQQPQNPDTGKICQCCGFKLLLKERYRPIQIIGHGGFGRTFLAVDEDIPSRPYCVIKQLYLHTGDTGTFEKATQLFHQEAVRLDVLGKHPQIPTLLGHFEQDRQLYVVQEYIPGQSLAQEVKQKGTFNEMEIWQLLRDLLPVLQYVHENQVIHRDIKPANIMRRQTDGKPILIDFGIAKLFAGTDLQKTGTIIGTPEFMAPEQMRGKTIPASDLYSLGLTCLYLLTGQYPSSLYDLKNDRWAWQDYLPTTGVIEVGNQSLRIRLSQVLDKLLQNSVNQRYLSAAAALQDLEGPVLPASPKPAPSPPKATTTPQTALPPTMTSLPPPTTKPQKNAVPPTIISSPQTNSFFSKLFGNSGKSSKLSDILDSAVGVDYTKLRDLLAAKKWKEADEETQSVLCRAVGKRGGYLDILEISKLPCIDLQTIDKLWVKYSGGRFGFSIQTRIYQELDGNYHSFCEQIGWPVNRETVERVNMQFNLKAPLGHLPSRAWSSGYKWWQHAGAMAAKWQECQAGSQ